MLKLNFSRFCLFKKFLFKCKNSFRALIQTLKRKCGETKKKKTHQDLLDEDQTSKRGSLVVLLSATLPKGVFHVISLGVHSSKRGHSRVTRHWIYVARGRSNTVFR